MLSNICTTLFIKLPKRLIRYIKYLYLGIKGRVLSYIYGTLGFLGFIKSLLQLPFEAYSFLKMDIIEGYI